MSSILKLLPSLFDIVIVLFSCFELLAIVDGFLEETLAVVVCLLVSARSVLIGIDLCSTRCCCGNGGTCGGERVLVVMFVIVEHIEEEIVESIDVVVRRVVVAEELVLVICFEFCEK